MPRKPRTIGDLVSELSARSEWLGKSASLLGRASTSLAEAETLAADFLIPKGRTIADLVRKADHRRTHIEAARASLGKAEQLLRDDLESIRYAAGLVERELGMRQKPGRPRSVTFNEIRLAKSARQDGLSWEQVRRFLNEIRRKRGQPALSSSTLRSAVNPRHPAKKPRRSKH
jgi:hypothetical protein